MRIGDLSIDPPVVLAPMSGINDRSFRLLCREQGASAVWTGLISANALHFRNPKTAELLRFLPDEHPVCAQVFGADPDLVAAAAAAAERAGADLVDINMGCSVPKVVKGRAGVALMADPDRAEAIVRACVAAVHIPVTAKTRTGYADRGEDAVGIAQRCERAGAAAVVIHPRGARQGYRGRADWSVIARAKQALSIPVIGNGDVRSAADALHMRDQTGCDAVMVGRAALGYPWIFRQIGAALTGRPLPTPPSIEERTALAARHVRLTVADRGEKVGVCEMRKHLAWYLKAIPMARLLRERANRATTQVELLSTLTEASGAAVGTGDRER
ncbi:MAG: tRNA dihydrouridine synthase DusB [Armatimonadota bacterium]